MTPARNLCFGLVYNHPKRRTLFRHNPRRNLNVRLSWREEEKAQIKIHFFRDVGNGRAELEDEAVPVADRAVRRNVEEVTVAIDEPLLAESVAVEE